MTPRDCMLYAGIRTSRRFAQLSWFQRDFFYGLLNVAWPAGRFEADVGLLRAALYAPLLSRVSKRDVQDALVECHRLGLVKLSTEDDGRGWGEVVNYRQHGLKKRKQQPDAEPEGLPPDPPGLFEGVLSIQKERKKEGRGSARAARNPPPPEAAPVEDQDTWVARLRAAFPLIDVDEQLKLALANRRKTGRPLERGWFENVWLPGCTPPYKPPGGKLEGEPDGWRQYLRANMSDVRWVVDLGDLDAVRFVDLNPAYRAALIDALRGAA